LITVGAGVIGGKSLADSEQLTAWLRAAGDGDHAAAERAYNVVYAELRRLAALQIAHSAGQTLTPTALVNETYLKLAGGSISGLNDRRHFFNLAARAMRQAVIDYAREHLAQKRGGQLLRTQLDDSMPDLALDAEQALAIEQAFGALEVQDAVLAQTLSWCVFGGLSSPQIAALRGVTERTVQRDLALARNYLRVIMDGAK
jgi:RNA polymerase sigma factor (TIGR02999 family)